MIPGETSTDIGLDVNVGIIITVAAWAVLCDLGEERDLIQFPIMENRLRLQKLPAFVQ